MEAIFTIEDALNQMAKRQVKQGNAVVKLTAMNVITNENGGYIELSGHTTTDKSYYKFNAFPSQLAQFAKQIKEQIAPEVDEMPIMEVFNKAINDASDLNFNYQVNQKVDEETGATNVYHNYNFFHRALEEEATSEDLY